jgi:pimeloyl-ACP methyl ester carboxylesterase
MRGEPAPRESKSQVRDSGEAVAGSAAASSSDGPTNATHKPLGERRRRGKRQHWSLAVLASVLVLAGVATALGVVVSRGRLSPAPTPTLISATFHPASCPFSLGAGLVQGKNVQCGSLSVPDDHTQPGGTTIRLAVAIFKTASAHPKPDPVIYLQGGPGGPLVEALGPSLTAASLAAWPADRDLILLDQRGTGDSQPQLSCPELTTAAQAGFVAAMRACHDRLVRLGVNLNDYTTLQSAADVHDLVGALGYRQVNLYSISYGTRLALTIMRLFPSDLRSVVLDSIFPPQANLFTELAPAAQRGFNALFRGCAASAACNSTYPHLQAVFAQEIAELNRHPASIELTDPWTGARGPGSLTDDALISELRAALYQTSLLPKLPALIYQVHTHDYTLASQISAQVSFGGINWGAFYSIECGEDMAFATPQALEASVQSVSQESRGFFRTYLQQSSQICHFWGMQPVPVVQKQAVTSDIPTLILGGEYDPATPPANELLAARTLSHSYSFLFPGAGHGIHYSSSCAEEILFAFQEVPNSRPAAGCINGLGEPLFE